MRAVFSCRHWRPHYILSPRLQYRQSAFIFRKNSLTTMSGGAPDIPTTKVGGNNSVPVLAYGTGTAWYKTQDSDINRDLVDSIKTAIKLGYHHLDGAEVYKTEPELGLAIKESGVDREKLYVVTKVMTNIKDIPNAIEQSLKKLQLEYVDLYLIHAPYFARSDQELQDAWAAMEKVKESGKAKDIGVSNYAKSHLEATLKIAKVKPAINQIEFHPYLQHGDFLDYHKEKGIAVSAYGPLTPVTRAAGGPLDTMLAGLANKYAVTPGDVALRWAIERGTIAITTSSKESRLSEYLRAAKFELTSQEVDQISEVGNQHHYRAFWRDKFAADDRT